MAEILREANQVLILGCAGGTLATLLHSAGKTVTAIDHNPLSFRIAQEFFGLPENVACICADFRDYLMSEKAVFDGIGIDLGGPGFDVSAQFDSATCQLVRARLSIGGRITMNVPVTSDIDRTADRIAGELADHDLRAWIFDQPGHGERNTVLACRPELTFHNRERRMELIDSEERPWRCRRARAQPSNRFDAGIGKRVRS